MNCRACGKLLIRKIKEAPYDFAHRKCCDKECMKKLFSKLKTKKTLDDPASGHARARKIKPKGPCEKCGKINAEHVHHKDRDPTNNQIENLERLCIKCHVQKHRRPKSKCFICGSIPIIGRGMCSTHYQAFRRHGDPLFRMPIPKHHDGKKVINIETCKVFMSIGEAADFYNLDRSCVSRALKKGTTSGGFHWSFRVT